MDKILIPRMVSTKTSNKVQLKLPQYFSWNPQMVIGEYLYGDGKTFPQESILIPLTSDHVNAIADAVDGWDCEDIFAPISVDGESEDSNMRPADPSVKNYSMVVFQDGKVWQRVDSTMVRQKLSGIRLERVSGMIAIRDAAIRLIQLQFTNCTDDEMEEAQRNLSAYYFPFVKKYGHVTERTNILLFREDADYSVLAALEYTDEEDVIHQADIFTKRTIQIRPPVTTCETPDEALLVCLDQRAVVDIDYIAELCACTSTEVIRALEGRLIFKNTDPLSTDAWLPQDVYLVGNVRKKLAEARTAALLDARFETNVVALENAAPPLIPFSDIFINLGAPYIPAETISSFVFDVFGKKKTPTSVDNVEVRRNKHDKWHIHISDTILPTDPYYFGEFGVKKYSAIWILEHLLNNTDLVATKKDKDPTGKDITVQDPEGTLILVEKAQAIKTAFAEWLSRHPDQQAIISALYNDIYNHSVIPRYDGSHLTFPGMTASIQLDPHQKNAVYRIIRDNGAYIAHVVGAGKTITLLTAGMELKRLGRVSKPLYVVPNNLISQWVGELQRLYPAASILAADPDDMRGNRRKRMLARMATGAYDAIIMGSSSFINLPPPYSAVQQAIEDRKQRVENSPFTDGCSGQAAINEAAKAIQESAVFFNRSMRESYTLADLGVDFLLVDESHEYKNLGARSSIGDVKGIPNTHSAKCLDMYYKTKYMSSLHGGKGGFVFASGTPYSNSIVEMYTVLRYFNEQVLLDSGIFSLDEWLAIYGKITNEWEIPPEGLAEDGEGLRQVRRVSGFANLPELMAQVLQFMDVVGRDDLKTIDLPTAVRKTTVARPSAGQKDYMSNLVARANKVRHRSSRKRGATASTIRETDNMLLITVDGRKCALDARMVDPIAFPASCGKLALCARQIADYYREYDVLKGTQLVFSEMAVSKQTNFSAYVALKDLLVANGIPEQEIAFAQDFDTPAKKCQMRVKMQCGKLRVLIGSTLSLGQGVNVQNRLIALHHLDVPWVPKDLEQREGRIIRRGNMHASIFIHTYVTEGSFDAYMWQLVEAKARIIAQIMRGDHTQRTLEESDTKVLSYAEVKALATGNTAYLERAKIEGELVRLATLKRNFDASMETMRQNVYVNLPTAIASLKSLIPKMESDIAMFEKNKATPEITISGTIYPLITNERPNITKALNAVMKLAPAGDVLGSFLGFDMILTKQYGWSLLCPERTVVLQGQTSHKLDDFKVFSGSSALDCCLRVCRLMSDELKAKQGLLVSNETALRATTAMLGEKFEHEDRINELKAELDRLTKEIAKCA